MTTLAVRFDQELSVAHAVEGALPCPRGILAIVTDPWNRDGKNGNRRVIEPCGLDFGHEANCAVGGPINTRFTVCGLSLADLPFVPSPEGMKPCPGCFDGGDVAIVEEAMFA